MTTMIAAMDTLPQTSAEPATTEPEQKDLRSDLHVTLAVDLIRQL